MQRYLRARTLVAGIMLIGLSSSTSVLARNGTDDSGSSASPVTTAVHSPEVRTNSSVATPRPPRVESESETETEHAPTSPRPSSEAEKAGGKRLDGDHQTSCLKRQSDIIARMKQIDERAAKQLELFDSVAARTQVFAGKLSVAVPQASTLEAAVATARAKAQTALAAASAKASISCTGNDPKGQVEAFKTAARVAAESLKAYRQAVRALVTAVKSAAPKPSASPAVSISPEAVR